MAAGREDSVWSTRPSAASGSPPSGWGPTSYEDGIEAIKRALDLGYRHLDTAELYENETMVGRALSESSVARDAVFLTTKVWKTNLAREGALASGRRSAEKLGVDDGVQRAGGDETLARFEDCSSGGVPVPGRLRIVTGLARLSKSTA